MQVDYKYFFASVNSGKGFINLFPEIFNNLKHLYIIKGGCGTGKSSFMKEVAKKAEQRNYNVEYFCCSSDPDSLDGIIINELQIGIIDGTSPHAADTKYPGAYDEIINTGAFWETSKLSDNRAIIEELTKQKSSCFNKTYSYLNAASKIEDIQFGYLNEAINFKKLETSISNSVKKFRHSEKGETKIRLCSAISMNGNVTLPSYSNAKVKYLIKGKYGEEYIFLTELEKYFASHNLSHTVSYNPLDTNKVNMIYLKEYDTLFTVNQQDSITKAINANRFIIKEELNVSAVKNCIKYKNELINEAIKLLSEIKNIHFKLEKIYIDAMNFEKMKDYTNSFIANLFK